MSNYPYFLTPAAKSDLDEIWESISKDSLDAADRALTEIFEHIGLSLSAAGSGARPS